MTTRPLPDQDWTDSERAEIRRDLWERSGRQGHDGRRAGERVDRVSGNLDALEPRNFDSGLFEAQAALFREGLALLSDAAPARRAPLEELLALAEFLGDRLPKVLAEWREHRDALRASGKLPDPRGG